MICGGWLEATYKRRQLRIRLSCAVSSVGSEASNELPVMTTRHRHCPMCCRVHMKFPKRASLRPSLSFFSPIVRWIVTPSYRYPYTMRLTSSGSFAKNVDCHWKFVRLSSSGSGMDVRLMADLRGLSNWVFWFGLWGVVDDEDLMWNVMRSFGLSLASFGDRRKSELDLCPGSSERMSDGSQRGVACENTLLNLAFILLLSTVNAHSRTR